jgi:hypothetical protein
MVTVAKWAADPLLIAAVRAHNANRTPEELAMMQETWAALLPTDPFVRSYLTNNVGRWLSAKRSAGVVEIFLSDDAGLKVGFMEKPGSWSHAGNPKHDVPMSGKTWQGRVALDESTGQRQLQISVPVLDDGKPIGSLVVGFNIGTFLDK